MPGDKSTNPVVIIILHASKNISFFTYQISIRFISTYQRLLLLSFLQKYDHYYDKEKEPGKGIPPHGQKFVSGWIH